MAGLDLLGCQLRTREFDLMEKMRQEDERKVLGKKKRHSLY